MDDRSNTLATARRMLLQRLESLHRAGVQQLGRCEAGASPGSSAAAAPIAESISEPQPTPRVAAAVQSVSPALVESAMPRGKNALPTPKIGSPAPNSVLSLPYPSGGPQTTSERLQDFAAVRDVVAHCTLCKELACTRTQTVFGVGNVNARVAFFGEAPGADEDRQGEPFVGRAGQLLTKIIEACGWKREDVYILNVLKCRPPDNRTPLPPEVDNCRQFFERQFEVIRPEYIVCVGAVPAQALLETTEAVGKLRGRFHQYRDSKVLVTYHPSYLLRNPAAKKFVWEDMQILLKEMGLTVPTRKSE